HPPRCRLPVPGRGRSARCCPQPLLPPGHAGHRRAAACRRRRRGGRGGRGRAVLRLCVQPDARPPPAQRRPGRLHMLCRCRVPAQRLWLPQPARRHYRDRAQLPHPATGPRRRRGCPPAARRRRGRVCLL
ncbi:hypothetical protein IWQ56_007162, partial [Coemansia nantahalensis]